MIFKVPSNPNYLVMLWNLLLHHPLPKMPHCRPVNCGKSFTKFKNIHWELERNSLRSVELLYSYSLICCAVWALFFCSVMIHGRLKVNTVSSVSSTTLMLLLAQRGAQLSPLQPKLDSFVFRNNTNLFSWLNKVICRVLLWEGCVSSSWKEQSWGWMGWLLGWSSPVHTEGSFPRQAEPWLGLCPGDAAGAWASLLALLWAFPPCTVPPSLGLIIGDLNPTSHVFPSAPWLGKRAPSPLCGSVLSCWCRKPISSCLSVSGCAGVPLPFRGTTSNDYIMFFNSPHCCRVTCSRNFGV